MAVWFSNRAIFRSRERGLSVSMDLNDFETRHAVFFKELNSVSLQVQLGDGDRHTRIVLSDSPCRPTCRAQCLREMGSISGWLEKEKGKKDNCKRKQKKIADRKRTTE